MSKRRTRAYLPITVGRALLQNKMMQCGSVKEAIEDLRFNHGIAVRPPTFYGWLGGWSAPNGNPSISPCQKYLEPPMRALINRWAGITDDSWWWETLETGHLKEPEHDDPLVILGLRPPE